MTNYYDTFSSVGLSAECGTSELKDLLKSIRKGQLLQLEQFRKFSGPCELLQTQPAHSTYWAAQPQPDFSTHASLHHVSIQKEPATPPPSSSQLSGSTISPTKNLQSFPQSSHHRNLIGSTHSLTQHQQPIGPIQATGSTPSSAQNLQLYDNQPQVDNLVHHSQFSFLTRFSTS